MANPKPSLTRSRAAADELFRRADQKLDEGDEKAAFKLFLLGAKAGDRSCQLNIGYLYDRGIGVRQNTKSAIRWYMRAYRRGDASAANNIATIWRDMNQPNRALSWFKRARELGDDGSNLSIAKLHLQLKQHPRLARICLEKVGRSNRVTQAEAKEASRLLKTLK